MDYNEQYFYVDNNLELPICDVCAPVGGFANHIRWLLLLDPGIQLYMVPTEHKYNIFKGNDWPTYNNFVKSNYVGISTNIQQEIKSLNDKNELPLPLDMSTVDKKINFIKQHVYGTFRSWHNWLATEWKYREQLNTIIRVSHEYDLNPNGNSTALLFTVDPTLSYKMYLKFNSYLNGLTVDQFKNMVLNNNNKHCRIAKEKNLPLLSTDCLFNKTLDPAFYQTLVDYLGMQNMYLYASEIHSIWYQLHLKSEKEFVSFVNKFYK